MPAYLLVQGLCPGCQLATWLPRWYGKAEGYISPTYDRNGELVIEHRNAIRKPRTGRAILDCPSGSAISETALHQKGKPETI